MQFTRLRYGPTCTLFNSVNWTYSAVVLPRHFEYAIGLAWFGLTSKTTPLRQCCQQRYEVGYFFCITSSCRLAMSNICANWVYYVGEVFTGGQENITCNKIM